MQVGKINIMPVALKHVYRVGEKVQFKFGGRSVVAEIVEDRGRLGHNGEQIVRVSVPVDATYFAEFELSASLVAPVTAQKRAKGALVTP